MGGKTLESDGYRSLFWPIILICAGVIWLLSNLGIISSTNLLALLRLWPLILIVVGLDLLVGRRSPLLGTLIGLGAVAVIIGGMLLGPQLGLVADLDIKTYTNSVPRDDAASAEVNLDFAVADTSIYPLTDSANLFEVEARHVGDLDFTVDGTTQKTVSLRQTDNQVDIFKGLDFLGWAFNSNERLYWNIGLNNTIPLDLHINGGVGTNDLNLSQTNLQWVDINGGVGEMTLRLPAPANRYVANLNSGAGAVTVRILQNADLNLNINGGVGGLLIDVPDDAAIQLEVTGGLGDVSVEIAGLERISGDGEDFIGDSGVWETSNYNGATRQITIAFDGGVGGLTIR